MKLHENQLNLIRHLIRFNLMAYEDCLEMLDTDDSKDRTALSYAFRPTGYAGVPCGDVAWKVRHSHLWRAAGYRRTLLHSLCLLEENRLWNSVYNQVCGDAPGIRQAICRL